MAVGQVGAHLRPFSVVFTWFYDLESPCGRGAKARAIAAEKPRRKKPRPSCCRPLETTCLSVFAGVLDLETWPKHAKTGRFCAIFDGFRWISAYFPRRQGSLSCAVGAAMAWILDFTTSTG